MQYMVIERYRDGKIKEVYQRFAENGRMMPDGVAYVGSWINESVTVCFQVMEAERFELLQAWMDNWNDLVDFEVIPVLTSAEAKSKVFGEK
jgi:Protein of unknown function (DUF3303)